MSMPDTFEEFYARYYRAYRAVTTFRRITFGERVAEWLIPGRRRRREARLRAEIWRLVVDAPEEGVRFE